jgi:exonuclease III
MWELQKISQKADIICLQEVHGNHREMELKLNMLSKKFHFFSSFKESRAQGGVVTLINKDIIPKIQEATFETHALGRALKVTSTKDDITLNICSEQKYHVDCW